MANLPVESIINKLFAPAVGLVIPFPLILIEPVPESRDSAFEVIVIPFAGVALSMAITLFPVASEPILNICCQCDQ